MALIEPVEHAGDFNSVTDFSEQRPSGTVLFISHDASLTGAPLVLLSLLRWLKQNRPFGLRILIGKSNGYFFREFEEVGRVSSFAPTHTLVNRVLRRFNLDATRNSAHLSRLREQLSREDIRLVYANTVASARMIEFVSFLDCPVICHVHELQGAINSLGHDLIRRLEARVSLYVAASPTVKQNLVIRYGLDPKKIVVVEDVVPIATCEKKINRESAEEVRRELNISPDAKLVVGSGLIETRKGTDLFLQVAQGVIRLQPDRPIHFLWVGGPPKATRRIQNEITSLGLGSRIHFIGQRANPFPYYKSSDVFLLTSREEPLGLVMLEAALCEKPIVCFEHSGHPPEFVRQGAGYAVEGFDTAKMAEKIIELIANPKLGSSMGTIARQMVLKNYDLNTGAPRIASAIENQIKRNS